MVESSIPELNDEPTEEELKRINEMRKYADFIIIKLVKGMRHIKGSKIASLSYKNNNMRENTLGFDGVTRLEWSNGDYIQITLESTIKDKEDRNT